MASVLSSRKGLHPHITFNDGAMVGLLEFLREVHTGSIYSFVAAEDRKAAGKAFEKGISCLLRCQIIVDGKPPVWRAQHDESDHRPRAGRTFEPASRSGSESVGIVRLLMFLGHTGPEIITAVEGAVRWFESSRITGVRLVARPDPGSGNEVDRVVLEDPAAPPLWARFYTLKTGKPLFCDRDGVAKSSLAEIGKERRSGYSWCAEWPGDLLEKDYPAWRKSHGFRHEDLSACQRRPVRQGWSTLLLGKLGPNHPVLARSVLSLGWIENVPAKGAGTLPFHLVDDAPFL
jgi:PelA/Pel-15E family pectate lyase